MFFFNRASKTGRAFQDGKTERITRPGQIIKDLERLKEWRCVISVVIPDTKQKYNSAILRVNQKRNLLLLDELPTKEAHHALLRSRKFNAIAHMNGVEYRFASMVKQVGNQGGIAIYGAPIPKQMLHIQKREAYRVPVTKDAGLKIRLPYGPDPNAPGKLCDLSLSGLGIQLDPSGSPSKGQVIPVCSIILPKEEPIRTEVEVCFAREDKQHHMRIGGRFRNLDKQQQKRINALIKRLERLYLRNHVH